MRILVCYGLLGNIFAVPVTVVGISNSRVISLEFAINDNGDINELEITDPTELYETEAEAIRVARRLNRKAGGACDYSISYRG